MLGELFDPKADLFINDRLRPHWSQAGALVFVTFRTADSIPREVVERWDREKQERIERELQSRGSLRNPTLPPTDTETGVTRFPEKHACAVNHASTEKKSQKVDPSVRGTNHEYRHWSKLLLQLTAQQRHEFDFHFNRCRETKLDEFLGACVLKRPELTKIVADSLMHFDGERYSIGDFVIMPNHVHLLATFATPDTMEKQFDSWLHFTAVQINSQIGTRGHFWQQEPFDHLVRSVEQYEYQRTYIEQNPAKAGLSHGQFYYRRYDG